MQKYHFIAIGGIGMSALARILLQKGFFVSGSDDRRTPIIEDLETDGASISIGYSPQNLPTGARIVYSTYVVHQNVEFTAAKEGGWTLLHRSQLLAELLKEKKALLVAGTHGKTTTSALLAHTLVSCGLEPSYAVGGMARTLEHNGKNGIGDFFIAEACESDGTFLEYPFFGGIVTNIDEDHLDYWKTKKALVDGFSAFIKRCSSPEHLFYCIDDPMLKQLSPQGLSYGFSRNADACITGSFQEGWEQYFNLSFLGKDYEDIFIGLVGKHNILNSAAVFALGLQLHIPEAELRKALQTFKGVGRRLEKKGEKGGITIYDDYGHHPTEIATTLEGLRRATGNKRLVAVFQPHRYTRTRDCLESFPKAFDHADVICITDIYSAGEEPIPGIDNDCFYKKMKEIHPERIRFFSRESLTKELVQFLQEGDVVLTIGAGDVTKIGSELIQTLIDC
jgi:UDP-N-acetylmuramate--alanine ligase